VYGTKFLGVLGWNDMAIKLGLQNISRLIAVMYDKEILGMINKTLLIQWKWSIGFNPLQNYEFLTPHDESIWLCNIRIL
jgi:hypothetical protein